MLYKSQYASYEDARAADADSESAGAVLELNTSCVMLNGYWLSKQDVEAARCCDPLESATCCYCGADDWGSLFMCDGCIFPAVGPNALPCVRNRACEDCRATRMFGRNWLCDACKGKESTMIELHGADITPPRDDKKLESGVRPVGLRRDVPAAGDRRRAPGQRGQYPGQGQVERRGSLRVRAAFSLFRHRPAQRHRPEWPFTVR